MRYDGTPLHHPIVLHWLTNPFGPFLLPPLLLLSPTSSWPTECPLVLCCVVLCCDVMGCDGMQSGVVVRFVPLLDRVLIRRVVAATKSAGGVLLPDSSQSKLQEGVVVRVGAGARDREGKLIAPSVKEGDKVVLPEYGGSAVKLGGEEFTLYREQDILGVLQ